jgi:hypothetical protein
MRRCSQDRWGVGHFVLAMMMVATVMGLIETF